MLPFHFIAAAGSAAAEETVTVALHDCNAAADETVTVALHDCNAAADETVTVALHHRNAAADETVTVALHHRNAAADETVTVALHHRNAAVAGTAIGVGVGAGLTGDACDTDGGVADVEGWAWAAAAWSGRWHDDDEQRLSAGDADGRLVEQLNTAALRHTVAALA